LGQVSLDGNSGLLDVSLAGTSSSSLARVVSADASSLGDFTAGDDLGTLLAGQTTFLGNLSFGGGLRRMVAAGIGSDANVQQTLTIGHVIAPAAADVTSLSLGVVYDLNINSESPLMALTANAWNDEIGGQNADVITAPWLSQLTVQGGFSASLALDPTDAVPGTRVAPGNMVLGAAVIGGSVTSPQWNIAGKVGGIATGDVDGLKLTAQSVAKATIRGSLSNSVLTLEQALSARQQSLAKLTVTGAVEATDILSIGNIGSVSVGRISGSRVFAGVNNGVTGLPVAGNFVAANRVGLQAVISQFAVTGLNTFGAAATLFEDSMVAAGNLGKVRVEGVDASNGQTFGFAADTSIRDLAWTEDNILVGRFAGTSWRLGPSLPEGDFMVRVV
jgi:hypothetical protein